MHKRKKTIEYENPKEKRDNNNPEGRLFVGKLKWVRYKEGAQLYSMGLHSFMDLAKEAKAVYRIKRICLVNTEKLDAYIELMYGEDPAEE